MLLEIRYPDAVLHIEDVRLSIEAGDKAGESFERAMDEVDNNIAVCTSEESGIARREKILGIQPLDTATLEERRLEVLLKWFSVPPYTERALRRKLDTVLGEGNYILTIDLDAKTISCRIHWRQVPYGIRMQKSITDMFEEMIPLDYLIGVALYDYFESNHILYTAGAVSMKRNYQIPMSVISKDHDMQETTYHGSSLCSRIKQPIKEG